MPKASLLTEDQRDQLLKEMAFGIPISELSVKYDLKPIQIEYQRGNNSSLYNLYVDFFCVKEEILEWEESDTFRFVLNLLYPRVKKVDYKHYRYKGKLYKVFDLIPEANKVLAREGLPLIKDSECVRVRYTAKRSADQQIDKTGMPNIIRKLRLFCDTPLVSKDIKTDFINGLLKLSKRVNWRTEVAPNSDKDCLPEIRAWYRLWTEGKDTPRGGKTSDLNILLQTLYKHDLLQNNFFDIEKLPSGKSFAKLSLKEDADLSAKFEFNGFKYIKQIETFINSFCLGLSLNNITMCFELALNSDVNKIKVQYPDFKKELSKFCDLIEDCSSEDFTKEEITCKFIHDTIQELENG